MIWIAGGVAKAGGIDRLTPYYLSRILFALLIGRDAPLLAETLKRHGVAHRVVETMENAVAAASVLCFTEAAPVVLLSPACASFDQYAGSRRAPALPPSPASKLPNTKPHRGMHNGVAVAR